MKRLDLDAAKSKRKKAKMANSNTAAALADVRIKIWSYFISSFVYHFKSSDTELRHSQAEFDRQLEITRLLLDGLNNSHVYFTRKKPIINANSIII